MVVVVGAPGCCLCWPESRDPEIGSEVRRLVVSISVRTCLAGSRQYGENLRDGRRGKRRFFMPEGEQRMEARCLC